MFEDAALDPVVGREGLGGGFDAQVGGQDVAVDEHGEGAVGAVGCGFGPVELWLRGGHGGSLDD